MTHNGGMVPRNTRDGMETIRVITQVPCLKQSSGMVLSHVYNQYMENDNRNITRIELEVTWSRYTHKANGVSMESR